MGIAGVLMGFDVKEIARITNGFPDSAELQLAKFRNGGWIHGIQFFTFMRYFYPEQPTYWWNTTLAHVKVKYLNEVIEKLRLYLPAHITTEGITHAYTLVGFLKEPSLLDVLTVSWAKYANPRHYTAFLWAVLKCFTKNDRKLVSDALSYWSTIPEKERQRPLNKELSGRTIDNQLKFLDWDFSEEQLTLLFELSVDSNLRGVLSLLFAKIDHPDAFAVVLDIEMNRDPSYLWHDEWDSRWDWSKRRYRLSDASLQYLLNEFLNTDAHPVRKYIAWRYWSGNQEDSIVLGRLQEIVDENDSLYEDSVIWRVKQGDKTATAAIKKIINHKPWLVRLLHNIWNEQIREFFANWFLQRVNGTSFEEVSYGLELLALLDNSDASQLLLTNWDRLKLHTRAIETALFLSTPATKAFADQEIRRLGFEPGKAMPAFYRGNMRGSYFSEGDGLSKESKVDLVLLAEHFKRMYMRYGAKVEGYPERLTREKLETLLPYLPLFDNLSIYHFALDSLRIGAPDLCYEKFFPLIEESHLRNKIRLTSDELTQEIIYKYQKLERDGSVFMDFLIEQAEKSGLTNEMLSASLKSFSERYHTGKAFFIIALILEDLGTRQHIEILDSFVLDSEQDRKSVEYWKANTVFAIKRRSLD